MSNPTFGHGMWGQWQRQRQSSQGALPRVRPHAIERSRPQVGLRWWLSTVPPYTPRHVAHHWLHAIKAPTLITSYVGTGRPFEHPHWTRYTPTVYRFLFFLIHVKLQSESGITVTEKAHLKRNHTCCHGKYSDAIILSVEVTSFF